ncbi:hypothetical protein QYF61_015354, partial [Mycteria americana]
MGMVQSFVRGGSDLTLGNISLPRGWSNTGTGFLERAATKCELPSNFIQVAASGEGATISGYLSRCKRGKRHWKKRWFVIKGKVLYTYIANEDKVATESLPLLGFTIAPEKEEGSTDTVFHLYHKQTLFYSFRAEDNNSAQSQSDLS